MNAPRRALCPLAPFCARLAATSLAAVLLLTGCGKSEAPRVAAKPSPDAAAVAAEKQAQEKAAAQARARAEAEAAAAAVPPKFAGLKAARAEGSYVAVLFENGRKGMFPTVSLTEAEKQWLDEFAAAHPLAHGKSSVVTAKAEVKATIVKQSLENGLETVQLCAPAKLRDQIGGTCMFYGRVHYLDIAGYPIEDGEIYRVINNVPKDQPYLDYHYYVGMLMLFIKQKPVPLVHFPDGSVDPFDWARQELRKGRPVLAALPENIWLSLPADFLATHPWDGNSKVGHQVVLNGFTWNATTGKGTFHVINSWRALSEFDVPVEARKEERNIQIEQSLSPRGELPEQAAKVIAGEVTELRAVGKQKLYAVDTNLGARRVLADSPDAAKALVEADNNPHSLDEVFAEYVGRIYDYIEWSADPKIRDAAAAELLAEIFKIPPNVPLPHIDFEAKGSLGTVYFVRVAPQKVVKLAAESREAALRFGAGLR
ncbi:MAG TPA: hypothetical protein VHD61_14900 [Lacunisphaera sp.]|nr:hypothetical protein [Lacunisphaera sp.]